MKTLLLGRIKSDATHITKVKNPTKEFLIKAIDLNYQVIWYLDNPADELVQLAVYKNVVALRDLPPQSFAVNQYAIKVDPRALKYIKDPAEEIQLMAVNRNGLLIGLIPEPSVEVQIAAVTNTAEAVTRIKDPHLDAQIIAIDYDYMMVNKIPTAHVEAIKMAIYEMKNNKRKTTRRIIDLTKHQLSISQWWELVQEFPDLHAIMNLTEEQRSYAILCS